MAMQFLLRSIRRAGSDLPLPRLLCRWPTATALARRGDGDPLKPPVASAHPHLNRLYGSSSRLISTEYMDPEIHTARVFRNSSHRDGAIYSNKHLQEEFFERDLADRTETPLEPMMFSKPTGMMTMFPKHMFQFFSVLLSKSPVSDGSVQVYGYIAARDERDGMLNYLVNYSRDDPIVVQQGSLIAMTGPKRAIKMSSIVLIEFNMRIKIGTREDDDLQLIDGAIVCSDRMEKPNIERIIGSSGAVDITSAVLGHAVEATIEVVVVVMSTEVPSGGLGLSLRSLVDIDAMDVYEEIRLLMASFLNRASKKVCGCCPDL